uniref:Uncharacterized protein n=1 Tax=Arundo donax TaxID=35708 RepID=A0A0A9G9F4_ARUDO
MKRMMKGCLSTVQLLNASIYEQDDFSGTSEEFAVNLAQATTTTAHVNKGMGEKKVLC